MSDSKQRGAVMDFASAFGSLVTGLTITFRKMFEAKVTETYPHEQPELSEAYRSAIKLVHFEDLDTHDCIACGLCGQICPSRCIEVTGDRLPGLKKKRAELFTMDFSLCSLCGLCLAVCPTDTLEYSRGFDAAGYHQDRWVHDLLAPFAGEDPEDIASRISARDEAKREATRAHVAKEKAAKEGEDG